MWRTPFCKSGHIYVCAIITDSPSITIITVEDIGASFITISWTSTSVGSVTYTITYSTGDVIISSINTGDTNYTINGLTSGTSYRISVVPSDGVCQGEHKEMMVNTTDIATTFGHTFTDTGNLIEKRFTRTIYYKYKEKSVILQAIGIIY